ncbi:MAG: YggS family pyridoxal phosphate-dependent enzyme [Hydrogenophaga sp.]|uniref:YggS family pyridoxal phosphate-dependent enzyme n=1 Tax=Hydrogenophaga sp. TaxID=1904254 RepID=UPI001DDF6E88|nr:YggS family pyridoxal phosphate-dependent enzyme [Hydrogenophaga sp.]MBX3609536.1 YggS family pyridoxal phosphate-dependent enzyme [Hydrogenophaga sp.]
MTSIAANLQQVRERLRRACEAVSRDSAEVTLLAVSKTFGPDAVRQAHAAGQTAFGENYVQEGIEKIASVADMVPRASVVWHCIGPLQSNKTRVVAAHFDWVQSIDRLKIAQRLSEQRDGSMAPLNVCLQLNVDGGANKAGVAVADLPALADAVAALPHLRLRGVMSIPEPQDGFDAQREVFVRVREAYDDLRARGHALDTLSMGMSDDLEAAVAAGATMVRVGRAVFGHRERKPVTGAV